MDMHAGQLAVTPEMVRRLVDRQFPGWRGLAITAVSSRGTVNALFRVGEELVARFPLVGSDPEAMRGRLEAEARAARELLGRTRFETPEPVALGRPAAGYPLPWSVQTWLGGTAATYEDPGGSVAFAHDLAEFVLGVRSIGTDGRTFCGEGRGGDLCSHDEWMETCFDQSRELLDVPRLRRTWGGLRELPRGSEPDVMAHGDLTPGNVLVAAGRLTAVIDVGGLGPADGALDLVGAWHLLEAGPRQVLRADLECDDLEWARGMAWAFEQAMGAVWYYAKTNPEMSQMGRRTLDRIMAES